MPELQRDRQDQPGLPRPGDLLVSPGLDRAPMKKNPEGFKRVIRALRHKTNGTDPASQVAGLQRAVDKLRAQGERDRATIQDLIADNRKLGRTIHQDAALAHQLRKEAQVWERMADDYKARLEDLERELATIAEQCAISAGDVIMNFGDDRSAKILTQIGGFIRQALDHEG
jgi:hypothetical protein